MKKAIYIYSEGKKIAVKTVDINAFQWFDKVNGNSYFAGTVCINYGMPTEKNIKMPFQYGYGDHYKDIAVKDLKENFKLEVDRIWDLMDWGVILRTNKVTGCKKRELKEFC